MALLSLKIDNAHGATRKHRHLNNLGGHSAVVLSLTGVVVRSTKNKYHSTSTSTPLLCFCFCFCPPAFNLPFSFYLLGTAPSIHPTPKLRDDPTNPSPMPITVNSYAAILFIYICTAHTYTTTKMLSAEEIK